LNLAERTFLRVWCVPPPPVPFEPRDAYDAKPPEMHPEPLERTRRVYGDRFAKALAGKVFLDIGCGLGDQVIAAAEAGAQLAVGLDTVEINLRMAEARAQTRGVTDRVRFTTDTIETFGTEWADVALSQNSFEHFDDPGEILAQAYRALKPGGQFFVTFGPSWWHPFGVHHMFMIKRPWAHAVFSEQTILKVRQLYRPNKPTCWQEVGLNKMTVAKLLRLVKDTRFVVSDLSFTPIRPLPLWLVRLPLFREWTTADTSVILTKPLG
jgi:SAM-dependent methyltransferase